jgi:predicted porin
MFNYSRHLIMKKTLLAVVTTSLFAASVNAATIYDKDGQQMDLYGQLRFMFGQKDNNNAGKADNFGGYDRVRFGTNGKLATGYNDVALISKLEWQVSSKHNADSNGDKNTFKARYAYVGADFANGVQAVVGSVASPYQELSDVTDTYENYSGWIENQQNGGDDIWDNAVNVTYAADGWDLRSAVAFSDEKKTRDASIADSAVKSDLQYAGTAGYTVKLDDVSSLKPVLAYQAATGTYEATGENYTNQQYAAGLGYTYAAFYLGSTYGQTKDEYNSDFSVTPSTDSLKQTVWVVTASYKVLPEWTVVANYGIKDPHNAGSETDKYYVLATQYDITAKAKAFAEYKINDVQGQDDNYVVGLQYTF